MIEPIDNYPDTGGGDISNGYGRILSNLVDAHVLASAGATQIDPASPRRRQVRACRERQRILSNSRSRSSKTAVVHMPMRKALKKQFLRKGPFMNFASNCAHAPTIFGGHIGAQAPLPVATWTHCSISTLWPRMA
jgi:hypothetical protein